jgi:hypothetical protein
MEANYRVRAHQFEDDNENDDEDDCSVGIDWAFVLHLPHL